MFRGRITSYNVCYTKLLRLKILVAEDTAFNQKFIQRLLDRWNHQISLVGNGSEVLEALKNESFDIVLMDA